MPDRYIALDEAPAGPTDNPASAKKGGGFMRWRTVLAGLLLILAVIGGGAYALSSAQPAKQAIPASSGPPPVPVVAESVKSGNVPIYLRGIGTVQAYNTDTIRTQVQGQITQVAFKEGQAVHAGDLLAQIDPRP